MAGQVGKLTLEAVVKGFEDVQGLGKALQTVAEKAHKTDKSFIATTQRIKEFGKATFKTNEGLKGQIAAFEKLRGRTDFQGRAYKNLTGEINALNRELQTRLGLEREIGRSATKRSDGRRITPGPGDASLLATSFDSVKSNEDFARRQSALQGLLLQRSFKDLNDKQKDFLNRVELTRRGTLRLDDFKSNLEFKRALEAVNASYLKAEQKFKGSGKEITGKVLADLKSKTGALNETQLQALSIQDRSNIRSEGYLEVLTKINAEETAKTQILGAQNTKAANQIAQMEAKKLITDKLISQQKAQAKSFLYQKDRGTFLDNVIGPKGQARFYDPEGKAHVGYGTQAFREMPGFAQRLMSIANMVGIKSPTYSMMQEELAGGYTKDFFKDKTATYFPKNVGEYRASGKKIQQAMFDFPFMGKKFPVEPFDAFGTGKAQAYPKTDRGLAAELENLQGLLPDLVRGSDEWVKVTEMVEEKQKELDNTIKKGNESLKKRRDEIAKAVNPRVNQKLLPPGKLTAGEILPGQKFKAPEVKKVAQSVDQLTDKILKNTAAGNGSINSLTRQRSKLEQLRGTLDPTSAAFKRITLEIYKTDKALNRLGGNKFSGANLRRTGQSILGAGFVGGPAGFLGAGIGAGVEALRPGGDMAGGAITGGLVASQVLTPVSQAIGGATTYASDIEKANIALRGITKSTENYEIAQAAITKAVEVYNVPQEVAIRGMTRLSAAVLGAGGNIHNATEAFLNTTVAIKGTAGSADDVKSAITAMVQIFSKGKVSAEELSGQLGERFPAAVTKFAKANDISTQELQANLKSGTVGLDMLSKFVTSLGEEYEPLARKIAASNEEAGARSQIAMNKMKIAVGTALKPIGADFQIIGAQLLTDLIPAFEALALIASSAIKPLVGLIGILADNFEALKLIVIGLSGAFAGLAVGKLVVNFNLLSAAIVRATASHSAFNVVVAANKYVLVGTAIATLTYGLMQLGKKYKQTAKEIKESLMGQSIEKTRNEIVKFEKDLAVWQSRKENGHWWYGEDTVNKEVEHIEKQIKAREDFIEAEKKLNDAANKAKFPALEKTFGEDSPFVKFAEDLDKFEESLQNVAVNGFKKLEDSILNFVQTGKLAIKDLVSSVIADLTRLMIRQKITEPLFSAFTSLFSPVKRTDNIGDVQGKFMPSMPEFRGHMAKGGVIANNKIVPYRKGGVVNRPTMFKYGGSQLGVMGEAGPEAILPLQRGRGGRLGVAMQGGGGTTNVNYTGPTLNFNGDEYVPRSAVGGIINAAARQGASMGETSAMRSLQNNRSSRSRLGM
jgi:tape measure domain-containing protein